MTYVDNYAQSVKTDVAEFLVTQRNIGFADNDGRWIVSQLPEHYWSATGSLRQRRPGKFLGAFDTREGAQNAIDTAEPQPIDDKMVL